jgi:hypothetical protein
MPENRERASAPDDTSRLEDLPARVIDAADSASEEDVKGGKVTVHDISIMKTSDKASPLLLPTESTTHIKA